MTFTASTSSARSTSGYVECVSNRFTSTLKKLAHAVVIVLLVLIPVPVGRLFARLFDRKPKPVAALVVKREDETDSGPRPASEIEERS